MKRDRIAEQIVNRLHVSTTRREVLRELRDKMSPNMRTAPEWRTNRRIAYKAGLRQHEINRDLYARVVTGQI